MSRRIQKHLSLFLLLSTTKNLHKAIIRLKKDEQAGRHGVCIAMRRYGSEFSGLFFLMYLDRHC